ncbi:FadR/GntR family transcriptional regulator [Limnohabitans sp.]|jgi:GntR family transcriptional regulator, transcriptional repressor for pyruvate dehydrogenase complex|uniref:FadR/GntR family transcriptional regulator n=1 Tax=Limnohabitans sp. TaxID=1907725 RepID=UPI00260DCAAE|nr:FadR/GntR family transcriptional regulator [Limnohabitans sp.]
MTTPERESAPSNALARLQPVKHERFAERVYESLFHAILTGKLAPTTRLPPEQQLATFFQVSRPVVRQALDRLRSDQLIESVRGSGTFVRPDWQQVSTRPPQEPDISHWLHGQELRLVLEPECAHWAALRRNQADLQNMAAALDGFEQAAAKGDVAHHFDFQFHEAIARASANPRMLQVIQTLQYDVSHAVNMTRHLVRLKPWQRTHDVLDEHRDIYRSIERQDAESARRAMRSHIEKARIRMLEPSPN